METCLKMFALNLLYGSVMSWRGREGGVREREQDLLIHNDNDAYVPKSGTLKSQNITQTHIFTLFGLKLYKRNG